MKKYKVSEKELVNITHPIKSIAELHLFVGKWDIPSDVNRMEKDAEGNFWLWKEKKGK